MAAKVRMHDMQASKAGKMLKGRQITYLVYKKFRLSELDSAMLHWDELLRVELKNDGVQQFLTDWDITCLQIDTLPDGMFMESLSETSLRRLLASSSL